MALLTAGTKLTTSLSALVFQPGGMSTADLAALNLLIKAPVGDFIAGNNVSYKKAWLENGRLFIPTERAPNGFEVRPGDYVMVDGNGWPFVVPGVNFGTSWQHS